MPEAAPPQQASAFGLPMDDGPEPVDPLEGVDIYEEGDTDPSEAPGEQTPPAAPQEPQEPQEPATEPEPEQDPLDAMPEPEEPAAPAEPEAPAAAEPAAAEETPRKFAGRFDSPDDMEKGYLEMWPLYINAAREKRQLEERNQALEEGLRQALPLIQQAQQARTQQDPGFDPEDPAQVAAAIEERARAVAAQEVQALREQTAAQGEQQAAQQAVVSFRTVHQDLTPTDEQAVVAIVEELNLAVEPELLDVALEAARNPSLHTVLRANPDYVLSDAGMDLARRLAGLPVVQQANTQRQTQAQQTQREAEIARATVEPAAGGTPPPLGETAPKDEFDEVLESTKVRSPIFGT